MNKLLKIDNIMYRVKDLERAANFYRDVLGLKQVWKDEERKMIGFVFERSDTEIVIHIDTKKSYETGILVTSSGISYHGTLFMSLTCIFKSMKILERLFYPKVERRLFI